MFYEHFSILSIIGEISIIQTEISDLLAENVQILLLRGIDLTSEHFYSFKLEFPEPCQPKLRISPPAKNYLLSPMMEADEPRKH